MAGKINGIWKGKPVFIKDNWSGHSFTDEELNRLFNDETITIQAVNKNGKNFIVSGKLDYNTWNGHTYIGFSPNFNTATHISNQSKSNQSNNANSTNTIILNINGQNVTMNDRYYTHKFNTVELAILSENGMITFEYEYANSLVYITGKLKISGSKAIFVPNCEDQIDEGYNFVNRVKGYVNQY